MADQPEKLPARKIESLDLPEATIEQILQFKPEQAVDLLHRFANGNVEALKILLFLNADKVGMREKSEGEKSKETKKETQKRLKELRSKMRADAKDKYLDVGDVHGYMYEFENPERVDELLQKEIAANPQYQMVSRMIDDIMTAAEKGEEELKQVIDAQATALSVNAGMMELDRQTVETVTADNINILYKLGVVSEAEVEQFASLPKEEIRAYTNNLNKKLGKYGVDLSMLALIPTDMVARLLGDESYFERIVGTATSIIGKLDNITKLANIQVYKNAFDELGPKVDTMTLVSVNKMTFRELKQLVSQLKGLEGGRDHPLIKGQKAEEVLMIFDHLTQKIQQEVGGEENMAALMHRAMEIKFREKGLSEEQKVLARAKLEQEFGQLSIDMLTVDQILQLVHTDPTKRNENVLLGGMGGGVGSMRWGAKQLTEKYALHAVKAAEERIAALIQSGAGQSKLLKAQAQFQAAQDSLKALMSGGLTAQESAKAVKQAAAGGSLMAKSARVLPWLGGLTALSVEMTQLARGNSKPREAFANLTENILPWIPGIGNVAGVVLNLKAAMSGYNLAGKELSSEEVKWRYGFAALSAIPFLGTVLTKGLKAVKGSIAVSGQAIKGVRGLGAAVREGRILSGAGKSLAGAAKQGKEAMKAAATKGIKKTVDFGWESLKKGGALAKDRALKYAPTAAMVGGTLGLGYIATDYQFGEKGQDLYMRGLEWAGDETVNVASSLFSFASGRTKRDDFNDILDGVIGDITGVPLEEESEENLTEEENIVSNEDQPSDTKKALGELKKATDTDIGKQAKEKLKNKARKQAGLEE